MSEIETVIVYGRGKACIQCFASARRLTAKGIPFIELDLDKHPEILAAGKAKGFMEAPTVITSTGDMWSGFNPAKIDALASTWPEEEAAAA
jgi:glutaredoxin-like protein NrdH